MHTEYCAKCGKMYGSVSYESVCWECLEKSEPKYPLCKRAGFNVIEGKYLQDYIRAADVEKMLESAPVVYGHKNQYDIND